MTDEPRPPAQPPQPDERPDQPQPPRDNPPDYWAQGAGIGQPPGYYQHPGYGAPAYPAFAPGDPYAQRPGDYGGYPSYPLYAGGPGEPGTPAGPEQPGEARKQRLHSPRRTVLIAAAVAALVGGGVGAGTVALAGDNSTPAASAGLSFSTQSAPAAKVDGTIMAAAAKIGPSVVTINVRSSQEADTGSGVIIRDDGYILTNNHVISAASSGRGAIQVVFKNGETDRAKIVGTDPSDDLAVIKVDRTGLTAATFASSKSLRVGQTVVAVGAPLGLSDTVTSGIVSTLTRPVTTSDSNSDQAIFNAIQTDAAINPGNSGGPLVNLNGDVVGINAAIATDQSQGGLRIPGSQPGNIGIGFAIPSDEASRIANELITTGHATHAVMGVSVCTPGQCPPGSPQPPTSNGAFGTSGALISSVNSGSPADQAGLERGDLVTRLDGQLITDSDSLVAAVRSHAPGAKVNLSYVRGGSDHTLTMTLGTGTD